MGNKGGKDSAFLAQGTHHALAITKNKNENNLKARLIFCLLLFFFISSGAESYAQSVAARRKVVENRDSIMPFKSRWALRTNAVDWVLMLPNLTAEFDLFGSPYKHYTLSLGIKGNWDTKQNYKPYIVYNLLDVRAEFRNYYRTTQQNYIRPDTVKANIFTRMKEDVFTVKRLHPRYWRAYYWGVYADAAEYTFKFGRTGLQGSAYGIGLSGGFSIPLYGYRQNFVDLELGASVGAVYTKYDKFERDVESNSYKNLPNESRGGHFVPFPVVNEVRVAFVYRFSTSVKNKYKMIDTEKINARQAAKQQKQYARDSISSAKLKQKELMLIKKDSLGREKVKEKELKILKKDSLDLVVKQEKLLKDSLEQIQKKEKEQAKQSKKAAEKESEAEKEEKEAPKKEEAITSKEEEKTSEDAKTSEQQTETQTEEQQTTSEGGE